MSDYNWALIVVFAPLIGFVGMVAGGFWGVGCSWLVVPSMLTLFDCSPMQAAGIGLLQMVPSIIGTVVKEAPSIGWQRGSYGRNLVIPLALGAFLTSLCGRPINVFFNDLCGKKALFIGFGIFMFLVGLRVVSGKVRTNEDAFEIHFTPKTRFWAFLGGLGAGIFSSVLGVGGAMVFRPVLANGFKIPELDTARCVRFLLLTTTVVGGMAYLFNNSDGFDFKILSLSLAVSFGGAIGFPLGARAHRIVVESGDSERASRCFAFICGIVCVNVILVLLGFENFSRYLMMFAAVLLMVFLLGWTLVAKKKLRAPSLAPDKKV